MKGYGLLKEWNCLPKILLGPFLNTLSHLVAGKILGSIEIKFEVAESELSLLF